MEPQDPAEPAAETPPESEPSFSELLGDFASEVGRWFARSSCSQPARWERKRGSREDQRREEGEDQAEDEAEDQAKEGPCNGGIGPRKANKLVARMQRAKDGASDIALKIGSTMEAIGNVIVSIVKPDPADTAGTGCPHLSLGAVASDTTSPGV